MKPPRERRSRPRRPAPAKRAKAAPSGIAQVNAYLAAQPAVSRKGLQQLRKSIRAAVPSAVEGFSYGIPAFKIDGRPLVWFAAFRDHSSFFPGAASETFGETNAYYWARQFAQWLKPSLDAMGVLPGSASDYPKVLMISDEIPEVLYHSHRVLVMREGRLTTDVAAADTSEDALRQAVNA